MEGGVGIRRGVTLETFRGLKAVEVWSPKEASEENLTVFVSNNLCDGTATAPHLTNQQ